MKSTESLSSTIELVLLLALPAISLVISVLDLFDLLNSVPFITDRLPALVLLSVSFVATYLVFERRTKLDSMAQMLDERTEKLLRSTGMEIQKYSTPAEWARASTARLREAKIVDSVSWTEDVDTMFRWSADDAQAFRENHDATYEIIRRPDVKWREVFIFYPSEIQYFENEKENVLDRTAVGYNLAYYEVPGASSPPLIGGFWIVDAGTNESEIFLASADSTILLSTTHPLVVSYYSNYFESLWDRARKLKTGPKTDVQALEELEARLRGADKT
jgi:hypothetical protein